MQGADEKKRATPEDYLLAPLLETPDALRAAYRRRKDQFDYQKIHPADQAKYVEQGWEPHRQLQSALWIK
jgi:hypothetical protein